MASSCLVSNSGMDEFKPRLLRSDVDELINNDYCRQGNGFSKTTCGRRPVNSRNNIFNNNHELSGRGCEYDIRTARHSVDNGAKNDPYLPLDDENGYTDYSCVDYSGVHGNGRPSMKHPTKVYGEITRPWTPVFALLEHKYIDKKTELGKPKRRGVIIPAGYTYGRPNQVGDGGSSEALHGWPKVSTTTLPFKRTEKGAQRDFMSLNKAAVSAGLVRANDQYEFRATHDVRRKTQSEDSQRNRTRRIPPSMVFGISTRPSTPIFDLLEHKYQDKWLQQRRQLELAKRQEENKQRRSPGQVYETRASLLRTYQNPVDADPLWQMPKFTKEARPSLQTFRSANARKSAYSHFESDKISRKGNLGHGVFESAKN